MMKVQKQNRAGVEASAFVSSLRGGADYAFDEVEDIDLGGGHERKNRMGQRQVPVCCV
jgi:hypothetical protein